MRRLLRPMTNGLDIVAVGVENESAVVIRMIVGAQARLAVVAPAGRHRRGMERIDLGARVRREGIVPTGSRLTRFMQPELRPVIAVAANLEPAGVLFRHHHHQRGAERGQRGIIKSLRSLEICDRYAGMVDHRFTSQLVMRSPVTGSFPSFNWMPCTRSSSRM